jgi:hypothetical protein
VGLAGRRACRAAARTACSRRRLRHWTRRTAGGGSGRHGWARHGSGPEPGHARGRFRTAGGRGAPIEWIEGNAQALPFAGATFDVVSCQLGLQFFADRAAALREMKRVLVPAGRAVVMVWREIDRSPAFALLAEALGRTISSDAEALMCAPFALGDARELASLLEAGGFCDCTIRAETGTVRFASAATFVRSEVGSPLLAPIVAAAPARAYERACARGRACPRPAHRAGLVVLPDRGASRALPRVTGATRPEPAQDSNPALARCSCSIAVSGELRGGHDAERRADVEAS